MLSSPVRKRQPAECGLGVDPNALDLRVPNLERFQWPKGLAQLPAPQRAIADDFVRRWHSVLPARHNAIERFNHT